MSFKEFYLFKNIAKFFLNLQLARTMLLSLVTVKD